MDNLFWDLCSNHVLPHIAVHTLLANDNAVLSAIDADCKSKSLPNSKKSPKWPQHGCAVAWVADRLTRSPTLQTDFRPWQYHSNLRRIPWTVSHFLRHKLVETFATSHFMSSKTNEGSWASRSRTRLWRLLRKLALRCREFIDIVSLARNPKYPAGRPELR